MIVRRVVAVAAVLLLAACMPGNEPPTPIPTPTTPGPTVASTSTAPVPTMTSESPSPTPTPETPTPSETLDADQIAARDVVVEYFRLQNEFLMDDSLMDVTPIMSITTGDAQVLVLSSIEHYRELNAVLTAPVSVRVLAVGPVRVEGGDQKILQADVCTDSRDSDMISQETGESVLDIDRLPSVFYTLDLVNEAPMGWVVGGIDSTPMENCP